MAGSISMPTFLQDDFNSSDEDEEFERMEKERTRRRNESGSLAFTVGIGSRDDHAADWLSSSDEDRSDVDSHSDESDYSDRSPTASSSKHGAAEGGGDYSSDEGGRKRKGRQRPFRGSRRARDGGGQQRRRAAQTGRNGPKRLHDASVRENGRKQGGARASAAPSAVRVANGLGYIEGWAPLEWPLHYLPTTIIHLGWNARMCDFAQGGFGVMAGDSRGKVDPTLCRIDQQEMSAYFRGNGQKEYSGCGIEMGRVIRCRERDGTVNIIAVSVDAATTTLPFPVAVVCKNVEQLNTKFIHYKGDRYKNPESAPPEKAMFVIPACGQSFERGANVVDMRRIISDRDMLVFMQLDEQDLCDSMKQQSEYEVDVRDRSKLLKLIRAMARDSVHPCYREAQKIVKKIEASSEKDKRCVKQKAGKEIVHVYWYTSLDRTAVQSIVDWVIKESRVIMKVSELEFFLVPLGGNSVWMSPAQWTKRDAFSAGFAIFEKILSGGARSDVDTSPEMNIMMQSINLGLTVRYL